MNSSPLKSSYRQQIDKEDYKFFMVVSMAIIGAFLIYLLILKFVG